MGTKGKRAKVHPYFRPVWSDPDRGLSWQMSPTIRVGKLYE